MAAIPGEVVVRGNAAGYTQEITAGGHRLYSDEPKEQGGEDSGPSPYQLLVAALGACTSITLTMYARRKQWPLAGVTIRLRHAKVHAADCAECETKDTILDRIERDIELTGDLTAEQRSRLLAIADRCPVHRTLEQTARIVTQLV